MLKAILSLVFSLLLLQAAKAETPDSLMVYLKNTGRKVSTKDSADFYRIVLPPDTSVDRDQYRIFDYYSDGKPKRVATSLTQPINLVLDGTCIDYFPNGKRKTTAQYKNGQPIGIMTNYYPNGKLYNILKIEDQNNSYYDRYYYYSGYFPGIGSRYAAQVIECRDSTGKLMAENGTGHVVVYTEDFKAVYQEGDLKNNKKEGEWRGMIGDSAKFVCVFHKDELKSGLSYTKSGGHYTFKQIASRAVFSDGIDGFYYFVKKNLQYPESVKKHHVQGSVLIGFYVEPNGTISDVKVVQGLMKSLDDEALRVVSQSPPWIPAYWFGIPMRTYYTYPVRFANY